MLRLCHQSWVSLRARIPDHAAGQTLTDCTPYISEEHPCHPRHSEPRVHQLRMNIPPKFFRILTQTQRIEPEVPSETADWNTREAL